MSELSSLEEKVRTWKDELQKLRARKGDELSRAELWRLGVLPLLIHLAENGVPKMR
jgi:hypothetical protein